MVGKECLEAPDMARDEKTLYRNGVADDVPVIDSPPASGDLDTVGRIHGAW